MGRGRAIWEVEAVVSSTYGRGGRLTTMCMPPRQLPGQRPFRVAADFVHANRLRVECPDSLEVSNRCKHVAVSEDCAHSERTSSPVRVPPRRHSRSRSRFRCPTYPRSRELTNPFTHATASATVGSTSIPSAASSYRNAQPSEMVRTGGHA